LGHSCKEGCSRLAKKSRCTRRIIWEVIDIKCHPTNIKAPYSHLKRLNIQLVIRQPMVRLKLAVSYFSWYNEIKWNYPHRQNLGFSWRWLRVVLATSIIRAPW
jgi:hypothetical protein